MPSFLTLYFATIPALVVLDLIWIGGIARNYYKAQLGGLLSSTVTWWAAGLLYILYAAGLVFFVIQPALATQSLSRAVWTGFFFGLVAFCIYDLTNLATTTNWPLAMSFVDMAYGAVAAALVSGFVFWVTTTFRF